MEVTADQGFAAAAFFASGDSAGCVAAGCDLLLAAAEIDGSARGITESSDLGPLDPAWEGGERGCAGRTSVNVELRF